MDCAEWFCVGIKLNKPVPNSSVVQSNGFLFYLSIWYSWPSVHLMHHTHDDEYSFDHNWMSPTAVPWPPTRKQNRNHCFSVLSSIKINLTTNLFHQLVGNFIVRCFSFFFDLFTYFHREVPQTFATAISIATTSHVILYRLTVKSKYIAISLSIDKNSLSTQEKRSQKLTCPS